MADGLRGRKVAILIAPEGTEHVEFEEPKKAVEQAGATVDVVGTQTGDVQTVIMTSSRARPSRWKELSPRPLLRTTTP